MTKGGVMRGSINVLIAKSSIGKSMALCHLAAGYARKGYNVLFLTLELQSEIIMRRIIANLLNTPTKELDAMEPERRSRILAKLGDLLKGDLRIQFHASHTMNAGHISSFISDMEANGLPKPDVVLIDYLNRMQSASFRSIEKAGSYQYIGSITNELMQVAQMRNVIVWTATQARRESYKSVWVDLEDTSDSAQTIFNADVIFGLSKLKEIPNTLLLRALKMRNDTIDHEKMAVAVDYGCQRLFDMDEAAQEEIVTAANERRPANDPFTANLNAAMQDVNRRRQERNRDMLTKPERTD